MSGAATLASDRAEKAGPVVDKVSRLLVELERKRFFGEVTIKIKAGEVSIVNVNEVLKPEDLK